LNFISLEDLKNKKRLYCFIAVIGATQFLIITIVAMFFYPGGYSFWTDHFSTLGLINSHVSSPLPGVPNMISFMLFITTLTIAGVTFLPLWIVIPSYFKEKKEIYVLSHVGSACSIASSFFLIGIGIFPADVFPYPHVIAAVWFFLSLCCAIFVYSIIQLMNDTFPIYLSIMGFIVGIFGVLYTFGLATGIFGGMFGLIDAILQKLTVYGFISWIIIHSIKIWQMDGPENI